MPKQVINPLSVLQHYNYVWTNLWERYRFPHCISSLYSTKIMTVLVAADFFLLDIAFTQLELFANLLAGGAPFVSVSTEPNCQPFPVCSLESSEGHLHSQCCVDCTSRCWRGSGKYQPSWLHGRLICCRLPFSVALSHLRLHFPPIHLHRLFSQLLMPGICHLTDPTTYTNLRRPERTNTTTSRIKDMKWWCTKVYGVRLIL